MNYTKHYNTLIIKASSRILTSYCEEHHILPRCMGGSDESDNLVRLTASEHFIAHLLLSKMYPKIHGLHIAAFLMSNMKKYNNKDYSRLREQYSKIRSEQMQGPRNHMFGKTHTDESRNRISKNNLGKTRSDLHKHAISKAQTGKEMSPTTRQKIRDANIGKIVSVEARIKLSNALKGKSRKSESVEKQRSTNLGSGNPNFGNGQAVTGEKNGMFGRKWYVNREGTRLITHPTDERLKTGIWQNRKEWK